MAKTFFSLAAWTSPAWPAVELAADDIVVGRLDVLGIGDLHAHLPELDEPGVAGGIPALVVDGAREEQDDLGGLGAAERRPSADGDGEGYDESDQTPAHT